MNIFRSSATPLRPVDAKSFVGPAHTKLLASSDDGESVHVYRVEFDDGGSRTAKGEKYTAYVKYPTRKTMENVTQIVVKKSD